jgi:hypothetical protein
VINRILILTLITVLTLNAKAQNHIFMLPHIDMAPATAEKTANADKKYKIQLTIM